MNLSSSESLSSGVVPVGSAPFVFWDGYGLDSAHSGIGYYAVNLYEALKKLDIHPTIIAAEKPFFGDRSLVLSQKFPKKIRSSKLIWPSTSYLAAETQTPSGCSGVFHGLSNINVPITKKMRKLRLVVTIHDITPLLAPNLVSHSYYLQFAFAIKRLIPIVDKIVTDSKWTARTICERFPEAIDKISVISLGRPENFAPSSSWEAKPEVSVLTVSRFEHYKNLEMIGKIAKKTRKNMIFNLVSDQKAENFFRSNYRDFLDSGQIRIHKNIDDSVLDQLFSGVDCYFQPSFYEGFCLPVMKAISFGVPIAFLKGSAVDEIALSGYSSGAERNLEKDFIDAIHDAVNKRKNSDFIENVRRTFLQFPTWDDAAQKLKNLYTSLVP